MSIKTTFYTLLAALFVIAACNQNQTEKTVPEDTTGGITSLTQPGIDTSFHSHFPIGDSTDVYGTGNFSYRDSLLSYHRGYSIPRDSVYKVWNIKEFAKLDYLILKHPLKPGPYLDRGNHFQNIKMYREAISDYNKYIQLDSFNQSAYMNRGNAYERFKIYDSALADYNKVLELKPNDTIANFNKGNIFDIEGRFGDAIQQYDTVLMKDPRLAKAYYNRGTTYLNMKNYIAAIRDWEEAIRLNPPYEAELRPKINKIKPLLK
jgi:tetratricopeptide (TPR) repeat protein